MANWEKLIEEHYEKKSKIDAETIYELVEQVLLEEGYQDSDIIKKHSSMRLSTKGTKKAGGEPFDEDPPKERSKSAPAGFGVLEEEADAAMDAKILAATKNYIKTNHPDVDLEKVVLDGTPEERKIMVPIFLRKQPGLLKTLKSALDAEFKGRENVEIKGIKTSGEGDFPIGYLYRERIPNTLKSGKPGKGVLKFLAKYVYKPFGTNINKGDVAEGILGAALYAKFRNPKWKVGEDDIKTVLEKISAAPDALENNPKKVMKTIRGKNGLDEVSFKVALSVGNYNGLVDPKWHAELSNHYKSAVAYVNGEKIVDEAIQQEMDKRANTVEIISDGVSDQKGTKVDVKVLVDGEPTRLGSISLKAGSKTMGQVGSGNWDKLSELLSGMFGTKPDPELKVGWEKAVKSRDKAAVIAAGRAVYRDMTVELAKDPALRRDKPEEQVDVIQSIINGTRKAATGGVKGVYLVDFDGGDYKVLNFDDKLEAVFRGREDFKLGVEFKTTGKEEYPKILIRDVGNDKTLIEIRMRVEGSGKNITNVRHYVEKTSYLGKLLDIAERGKKQVQVSRNPLREEK